MLRITPLADSASCTLTGWYHSNGIGEKKIAFWTAKRCAKFCVNWSTFSETRRPLCALIGFYRDHITWGRSSDMITTNVIFQSQLLIWKVLPEPTHRLHQRFTVSAAPMKADGEICHPIYLCSEYSRHVCIFSMESSLINGCCNQQPIDIASRPFCPSFPHNVALFPLHWNRWLLILPLVKLLHSDGPPYFLGKQQASIHQQISAKMTFPRDYSRRQLFECVFVRLSRDTITARKSAAIETASDSFRKHDSVFVF